MMTLARSGRGRKPYRERLVPAELANRRGTVRLVPFDEECKLEL